MPPVSHVRLPGPDQPPRRKPRKPRKPKLTAPKGYLGGWRTNPGLDPKKYKTVKTGQGYFIAKKLKPKAPKPKGPGTGAAAAAAPGPTGPYSEYAQTAPWAIPLLQQLDKDQAHHQGYVTGQVMPWLSQGLQNLTGVNPAAPGYNPTIQQQYLANVQGVVGGAYNAAAAATPASFQATTPGALTASPTAYQSQAMQQYSANMGSAAMQSAQAHAALNTLQPNTFAQSALRTMADYAAGLPQVYIQKRNELRAKIDQFVAEQQQQQAELAEAMRHNKVTEAISSQNATTNAAIQFGRLGLSADEIVASTARNNADNATSIANNAADNATSRANNAATNATSRANNAADNAASGATGNAGKPINVNQLRKEGFVGGYKVRPKKPPPRGSKSNWTKGTDGLWYYKPGGKQTGGAAPATENIRDTFNTFYYDKIHDKLEPEQAVKRVGNWVLARRKRFTKNGRANVSAIKALLVDVIDTGTVDSPRQVGAWLDSHIDAQGRWR